MPKLHELLAVEPDLKGRAIAAIKDAVRTLGSSVGMVGSQRSYAPLEEGGETFQSEIVRLQRYADDVLGDVARDFGNYLNVTLQKEVTNASTGADVVVDGKTLFAGLPSPALLNLEARLQELKSVYEALPTLDQADSWERDAVQGYWKSAPSTTYRTKKVMKNHVKADATKEHPAQVEVYTEDVRVGSWTSLKYSGQVSPLQKQKYLARIEAVIKAVKQARQRANDIEAKTDNYADSLLAYINQP